MENKKLENPCITAGPPTSAFENRQATARLEQAATKTLEQIVQVWGMVDVEHVIKITLGQSNKTGAMRELAGYLQSMIEDELEWTTAVGYEAVLNFILNQADFLTTATLILCGCLELEPDILQEEVPLSDYFNEIPDSQYKSVLEVEDVN